MIIRATIVNKSWSLITNFRFLLICVFTLFANSCSLNFNVNEPVDLLWDKTGKKNDSLIIFLPGLIDTAKTFKNENFFTIAREAGIKADMVSASIHIGHLIKEVMVKRLETDIFNPAIKAGYHNIWLVGLSIGGLNALLFYKKYEKNICGVVTISPYIADTELRKELQQAGSVKDWQPKSVENMKVFNKELQFLWVWLQKQVSNNNLQQIYLGYGEQDRYIEEIKLLQNILDNNNVITVDGHHNWVTGQKIWRQQLLSRKKTGLLQPCN